MQRSTKWLFEQPMTTKRTISIMVCAVLACAALKHLVFSDAARSAAATAPTLVEGHRAP